MAISADSYGSVAEVEALTHRYGTTSGTYDGTTTPTLTQVERFIDRGSNIVDTCLESLGFDTPITQADAKDMLGDLVVGYAVEMVYIANSAGRWFDKKPPPGMPAIILRDEIKEWLENNAPGLERLGAARSFAVTAGVGFRETDESGDTPQPLFQREAFGETYVNWDE